MERVYYDADIKSQFFEKRLLAQWKAMVEIYDCYPGFQLKTTLL